MASSSSSSSSSAIPRKQFDVFLSFKGEVRNRFLSHLRRELDDKHVIKYYDEENLEYDEKIKDELEEAIKGSEIAIIVLSKEYADSSWCLDEMAKIMECKKDYAMTVIPVFFDVEPRMVRNCDDESTSYGVAFSNHEKNSEKILKVPYWRDHLKSVPEICGEDVQLCGRDEATIVKLISEFVFKKLPINHKTSTEKLVGMESRVRDISQLIIEKENENETLFMGIYGTGGLGKTTVARYVFNKFRYNRRFDESYFFKDVGLVAELVKVQTIILSEFLHIKVNVATKEDGTDLLSSKLRGKRVLLVLDNVKDQEMLSALAGEKDWFRRGSVIMVTTRDQNLLHGTYRLFTVELLSKEESMELFCKHAFKKDKPIPGFEQLSGRFVIYASGLPLALEVIGCHLHPLGKRQWIRLRDSLGEMPEEFEAKITSVLRISYDGLTPSQQKIFLDIACLFRGNTKKEVKDKIHSLGLDSRFLKPLFAKSLIHIVPVDYGEYLGVKAIRKIVDMHDLIQEMGWRIVRQVANGQIERYSRLWSKEHVLDMPLTSNTVIVEAERMVVDESSLGISLVSVIREMNRLRLLEVYYSLASPHVPCILRAERLQWLCLSTYPLKDFPTHSGLLQLVCIKMPWSSLQHTPNFQDMPKLEILDLSCSTELIDIDASIGTHKKLRNVNLSYCHKINNFPTIVKMESLEILDLSHTALESVPEIQNAHRLRKLNLSTISSLTSFPLSIGFPAGLQELNLDSCMNIATMPDTSFGLERLVILRIRDCRVGYFGGERDDRNKSLSEFLNLPRLKILDMANCNISELIIDQKIERLPPLQYLDLSSNDLLVNLPESIRQFTCLRKLRLADCNRLETISQLPSSLTSLEMRSCIALRSMPDLLQLLDQNEHWSLLDLQDCHLFATTPEYRIAFRDKEPVEKMLQNRKTMLQVILPGIIEADWFRYQENGHRVNVTIDSFCPSSIKGFAIMAICSSHSNGLLKLRTPKNNKMLVMEREPEQIPRASRDNNVNMMHAEFLYVPIDEVIDSRNLSETPYLFEVLSSASEVLRWGCHVVYERGVDEAQTGLAVTLAVQLPGENIVINDNERELANYLRSGILSVKISGIKSENCKKMVEGVQSSTSGSTDEQNQPNTYSTTNSVSGEEEDSYSWNDWLEDSDFYMEQLCTIM